MEKNILERKKKALLLIGLAYLIPLLLLSVYFLLFSLNLSSIFLKIFRSILNPYFLLFPGFLFLGLFYLFNLPIPKSFTDGEVAAFFSPITFIGSYFFWMFFIWIVYLLVRNKSKIKKKIGLFITSFITTFTVFISLGHFYTHTDKTYSLFFLGFALSIILLTIFITYKLYKRLVYEDE